MSGTLDLAIVIPAYNEASRVPRTLEALAEKISGGELLPVRITEVLLVDDGSTDATVESVRGFSEGLPGFRVLRSPSNFGKGHAVRQGLLAANSPWVLIADADMSTPWGEVTKLAEACLAEKADIAIGSRDLAGSVIKRHQSFVRESLGKLFNLFVRLLTGLPFRDTQCGFKLIKKESVAAIVPGLQVDRFAWDVEFLIFARAGGLKVVEKPVEWEHREESRVRFVRDGFEMLCSVLKVRFRRLGAYLCRSFF